MAHDDSLEMVSQLRTWIEKRFLALQSASSDEAEKDAAKARYREVVDVMRRLEKLQVSVPEEIRSEKAALEEFLHTPNEETSELVFLSKELSSLAKDINYRLRGMRSQKSSEGKKAPPKRLRVEFSDGTIIDEPKSTNSFVDSIRHMGLQRVSELPIKKDGVPLVSTQEPDSPRVSWKFRKIEGYFVNTHSGTNEKARYIQRVADALRLDISVSVVD